VDRNPSTQAQGRKCIHIHRQLFYVTIHSASCKQKSKHMQPKAQSTINFFFNSGTQNSESQKFNQALHHYSLSITPYLEAQTRNLS